MSKEVIETEISDRVAWLFLNRPHALNSLNDTILDHLDSTLAKLEGDKSVRIVVITGRGKAFCAGADLTTVAGTDLDSINIEELLDRVRRGSDILTRLKIFEKPVIAAVNGYAVAGGMSLMMACDLVIAAQSARIGDSHSQYGIVSGSGGTIRLAKTVGPVVAKYLAFRGTPVPASELLQYGLINEVVPDENLYERVSELTKELASRSPRVLASLKRLIDDGIEQPAALAAQTARQSLALHVHSNNDMQEGLTAFREKREPKFHD